MKLMLIILIPLSVIAIVIMLREKSKVREFLRWYEQNIIIYDIFYPVLAKAIEQKADFFESSSIKGMEGEEIEPMIIQVDRTMFMIWKKNKVRSAVYGLERVFIELAEYSEELAQTIEDFEELKSKKEDIYKKLYHIRLLKLNLPQS